MTMAVQINHIAILVAKLFFSNYSNLDTFFAVDDKVKIQIILL